MGVFLVFASVVFFFSGSVILLSQETYAKITRFTNQLVFNTDEKISPWRRPMGIGYLILAIFLLVIVLSN